MKITLLGTGSPVPMRNRASSGYLVEIGEEILVFDHGAGSHDNFLRTGFSAVDLNTIFFTHLHTDHCLDYPRLVHSRWDQGAGQVPELKVYAPSYMQRMTDLLFEDHGVFHPDLDGRINSAGSQLVYQNRGGALPRKRPMPDVTALYDGMVVESDNWKVTVREVFHQPGHIEPYGLRLETDEGVLVYSGDTGPCIGISDLAKDADMLIHMCYFISGTFIKDSKQTSSGHLECARLAAEQNVKTLVTTHFTPQMDAPGVKEQCLGEMREIYQGRIVCLCTRVGYHIWVKIIDNIRLIDLITGIISYVPGKTGAADSRRVVSRQRGRAGRRDQSGNRSSDCASATCFCQ